MKRIRNAMFKASDQKEGTERVCIGKNKAGKKYFTTVRNRSLFSVSVVVIPAKYKKVRGQRRKVMPAQGPTRRQSRRDRATSLFLAKIASAKRAITRAALRARR